MTRSDTQPNRKSDQLFHSSTQGKRRYLMTSRPGPTSFIGTWMCKFYRWEVDQIQPPGSPFPLTIEVDPNTENGLTGFFPTPDRGKNATMTGTTSNNGKVWVGSFSG